MARYVNFSAGIQAAVYTYARVRYIVSMVVVGLEPRKPTDKFKIRHNNNNNMMVRDNAVVIAKCRRGFCLRGFFSCKMPFVYLIFFFFFFCSLVRIILPPQTYYITRRTRYINFSKFFFHTTYTKTARSQINALYLHKINITISNVHARERTHESVRPN